MRELELKLAVHGPFVMPDLTGNGAAVARSVELPPLDLRAIYYDTPDLRLARHGVTLRHRTGEAAGDGWTLKLPVAGETASLRNELHFEGSAERVPDEVRALVVAFARSAEIGPVSSLRTLRRRWMLYDLEGRELAELLDDEVSVLEEGRVVARFREIEIEDRSVGLPGLEEIAGELRAAGAVMAEPIPKAVRALGARATADPDVPPPVDVAPSEPSVWAIRSALSKGAARFISHDPGVRLGDVESVHQMRVAARRIRSDLRTFATLVDAEWAEGISEELRWIAHALGGVRDADVLRARLIDSAKGLEDDLGPLWETLERRHAEARARLNEDLDSDRYVSLLDRLVGAVRDPVLTSAALKSCEEILPQLVGAAWKKLAKVGRAIDEGASDEDLHKVRIKAKRARYAAEAVAPNLSDKEGKKAETFAAGAERIQDVLGEHQDTVVARAAILEVVAKRPQDGPFNLAAGRLIEREERIGEATRRAFPMAWKALDRKKRTQWMKP